MLRFHHLASVLGLHHAIQVGLGQVLQAKEDHCGKRNVADSIGVVMQLVFLGPPLGV